ncbi:tripartite motif-containing protein 10-like [Varanus komodoensis]|uniref:tripartite motif-containing protein 10-like n=1 Tax=Varanus komodoensis TaxID=61221 RepID=UPI001CF7DD12|nr:tripartite motif-containing protein 10-like [Varanus komodoensis]
MEEETTCPICLEHLKDPVTLDCGHNYCQACISKYCESWGEVGDLECPICKAPFKKGNFRPNWQLASIVKKIQLLLLEKEQLCATHQEKLLLFCKEDEELVCWKCKHSPEHETHTVLLKEEVAQQCKDWIHHHLEILREEREKLIRYKEDTEKEKEHLLKRMKEEREKTVAQFRELYQCLEKHKKYLLDQMEELEEEIARRGAENLARLSGKLSSLEGNIQELEEKSQKLASELLKDVKIVLESRCEKEPFENPVAFPTELKWRIWNFCDINPFLEGVMRQFKGALLSGPQATKANVTLDPVTADPWLILSEDQKRMGCGHHQNVCEQKEPGETLFPFFYVYKDAFLRITS